MVSIQLSKILKPKTGSGEPSEDKTVSYHGCLSHGAVIVYVWRKRDAEVVAENLVASGVEGGVVVYHGGMDSEARKKSQSKVSQICSYATYYGGQRAS